MKRNPIAVPLIIVAIQGLVFMTPAQSLGAYFNVIRPLLYIMLAAFCLIFIGKDERTYEIKTDYLLISIFGVLIYLAFMFAGGYLKGFNYNPMDLSLRGILTNSWAFLSVAVLREYIRSKIMAAAGGKILVFAAFLFTFSFMDNNIRSVITFPPELLIDYALTVFLPLLALNFFLVWTARLGGLAGNLVFATVYQAIPILSPYLPDMPRILEAILLYTLLFIMYLIVVTLRWRRRKAAKQLEKPPDWRWLTVFGGILAVLLLFGFGVFRYIPVAVASNSMQDVFAKGDVVIVEKITDADMVAVGDIIEYRSGSIAVIHRVVEITYTAIGGKQFITKGDNNPAVDLYPVRPSQIVGLYKYHIPYLGYPALLFTVFNEVQAL